MNQFNFIDKKVKNLIRNTRLIVFDFDGVFTDNRVFVFEDGTEAVSCYRGDGIGLKKLKDMNIQTKIISSEVNPVILKRAKKLDIDAIHAVSDKKSILIKIINELNIDKDNVAFVGNDINDLSCLKFVSLPIAVNDSHPDVFPYCLYRTSNNGGYGAVREICDLFENVKSSK